VKTRRRTPIRLAALVVGAAAALVASSAATAAARDQLGGDPRSQVPVFVLEKGRFTTFDAPGDQANELVDVNVRGQVAGTYIDADGSNRGFLRDKRGRVAPFEYPGATGTFVNKVNDRGQIVGNAKVTETGDPKDRRAYLRDPDGRFTTIRVPGAVSTQAVGLDDRGRVVGDYLDDEGVFHGYLWEKGRFTTFDGPEGTGATLTGVNDRGHIVGVYQPRGATGLQGFLLAKGVYRTIKDPRLAFTLPLDINDDGQIVGFTTDALPFPNATTIRGFLLKEGADGPFTPIDVPGAPKTLPSGIDDRGRLAGLYQNPNAAPTAQPDAAGALMGPLAEPLMARP
jgi:hypothetical protein